MSAADLICDLRSRIGAPFDELYSDLIMPEADLAAAEAEVSAVAATRYALPLGPDPLVKHWILTLAEELAWSRTMRDKLPEFITARVAAVRGQLELLTSGKIALQNQAAADSGGAAAGVMFEGNPPAFTRDKLAGY